MTMQCRVCSNIKNNVTYEVPEMMYGTRETFTYFQCARCRCLQIVEIPSDMTPYYPKDYYSFSSKRTYDRYRNPLRRNWKIMRDYYTIFPRGLLGTMMKSHALQSRFKALSKIPISLDSKILDVGCGAGWYLYDLRTIGFTNLLGVDPYVKGDIEYLNGLKILRSDLYNLDGEWDLIMYHHSFEHVPDPPAHLSEVYRLLRHGGTCMIRVPTVSSYAWEHYRTNWVQLDAPRHYFLHSIESMRILAEKAGLHVQEVLYDSSELQFYGSELYLKGIPLVSDRSHSFFQRSLKKKWKRDANALNARNAGDQAVFYLTKD